MKKANYECYMFLSVDYRHNTYPIGNPHEHVEKVQSLVVGDIIQIKGLGRLFLDSVDVDEFHWVDQGEPCLYESIEIRCVSI